MRTSILLISLAAVVAACSEQQPTSPAATARPGRPAANNSASANGTDLTPQAKPVDQVGFTKAVVAFSPLLPVGVGQFKEATAWCSAGIAIGGGYQIYQLQGAGTQPIITANRPATLLTNPTGWTVYTTNNQAGAVEVSLRAYAVCVS